MGLVIRFVKKGKEKNNMVDETQLNNVIVPLAARCPDVYPL